MKMMQSVISETGLNYPRVFHEHMVDRSPSKEY